MSLQFFASASPELAGIPFVTLLSLWIADARLKLLPFLICPFYRVQYALAKIRAAARHLLTLEPTDPTRAFQGAALLRRMIRLGLLNEKEQKLDYVLGLTISKFMERRLQTKVYKLGHARTIHHARCLIVQRHIRVGRQIVNVPSFVVRVDSEKHIDFSPTSPLGGGPPGRVKRKKLKASGGKKDEDEE